MIVVDTTVLVYAVGAEHVLRDPCRAVIRAAGEGTVRATTTVEVVQEFVHVRSRRRTREDAVALARDFVQLLGSLQAPDAEDLAEGLDLYLASPALGAFDAVLAAVARRRGAAALVSADSAFGSVEGLVHLDPASPGFLAELERQ